MANEGLDILNKITIPLCFNKSAGLIVETCTWPLLTSQTLFKLMPFVKFDKTRVPIYYYIFIYISRRVECKSSVYLIENKKERKKEELISRKYVGMVPLWKYKPCLLY